MADLAWLKITLEILYYITLPLTTLLGWLLIPLAPFLHLGGYIWTSFMLPLRLLAKFETLYIYLGVAALIGIFTGTVLHLSSTVLVSLLDLQPVPVPEPEGKGRTAASVRAAREQKKLEEAWQLENSLARSERDRDQTRWKADSSLQKWLEKDAGRRRDEKGVLGQTILEEDDDSEDVF